jgi:hypothetical protein
VSAANVTNVETRTLQIAMTLVAVGLGIICKTSRAAAYAMLKYLGIAVTALSLTACVLLAALWVRSYWRENTLQGVIGNERLQLSQGPGVVVVLIFPNVQSRNFPRRSWTFEDHHVETDLPHWTPWMLQRMKPKGIFIAAPHWFLALLSATLGAVPWLKWQFSLRTLLIATTLVAVALGLVVMSN